MKKAHIGIAVEGATDAARGAADIVLTEPGLSVIIDAMILSRKIFQRVRNYCIFRISGTIQLIVFFFVAVFCHPEQYFPSSNEQHLYLPVISIVLITILNDACVITIARDNVKPNNKPQPWNMPQLFAASMVLGTVACIGSLLLLYIGLLGSPSQNATSSVICMFFKNESSEGKCSIDYSQLLSMIYLKLSLTDFITVFAARTTGMFFSRKPGNVSVTITIAYFKCCNIVFI